MKQDLGVIGALLGRWAGIALLTALPVLLFHLDTLWLGNNVGEWSLVEVVAELFLASAILGFIRLARLSPDDRGFAVLAAAFLGCMLVRELDALLDLVFDGLWQVLVTGIAVSTLAWAWRNRVAAAAATRRFVLTRQASTLAVGMAVVLVFSRLFGMGDIWGQFVDLDSARVVKNAVEECTELLGYSLVLVGSAGYVQRRRRGLRHARAAQGGNAPAMESEYPVAHG